MQIYYNKSIISNDRFIVINATNLKKFLIVFSCYSQIPDGKLMIKDIKAININL